MHEAPDSALNILCKIDTARLSGDYERALYALLMSQALDKNHIYVTNDSLVTTAFNYFSSSKDINRKMLANYYIARQKYNSEDYTSYLVYFLLQTRAAMYSDFLKKAKIAEASATSVI